MDNKDVAVIGPNMIDSNGDFVQIQIYAPTLSGYWRTKKPFKYFFGHTTSTLNYDIDKKFVGMVQGSSYMIKSYVFKQFHYLDEGVFLFGEESILAHKLKENGYLTLLDHEALVKHDHSTTISKEGKAFERLHMYFSTAYVLKKYCNIGSLSLLVVNLYNIINYATKGLTNTAYRKNLKQLIRKLSRLSDL